MDVLPRERTGWQLFFVKNLFSEILVKAFPYNFEKSPFSRIKIARFMGLGYIAKKGIWYTLFSLGAAASGSV